MKKSKKRKWINEFLKDKYVIEANRNGFRSRAAYKLLQMDEEFGFLKKAKTVLDIGSAPGSWLQVIEKRTNPENTKIVGIDLLPYKNLRSVNQVIGDFCQSSTQLILKKAFDEKKIDLILSDMAPNLSGVAVVDSTKVSFLIGSVVEFSVKNLNSKGSLVIKILETGSTGNKFVTDLREYFKEVWIRKPEASKNSSTERYLIAKTLK